MKKNNLQYAPSPTRRFLRQALVLTLAVFFLPAAVFGPSARGVRRAAPEQRPSVRAAPARSEEAQGAAAAEAAPEGEKKEKKPAKGEISPTVRVKMGKKVKKMELEDYLWGVIAAEMPAAFRQEALNAQAIAARTYTLYRMAHRSPNHSSADLCTDPGCCQAWISRTDRLAAWEEDTREEYAKKITAAVEQTRGRIVCYQDEPIMAAFHDSSAGMTRSAREVWGSELPYLQAVDSPEGREVPDFYSVVTVKAKRFKQVLQQAYPKLKLGKKPEKWLGKVTCDPGGLPLSIRIGGTEVPTRTLRTLFGLRSACVEAEWDGKNVVFSVTGYGHGVGMSQYGADALAKEGKSAAEILRHYYTGVEVKKLTQ